ncbi:hypothetical protein X975_15756, partial [Stegodyphus mimosarum]
MLTNRAFQIAFVSRFCVILFQVLFNVVIPDHKADAFRLPYSIE